MVSGATIVDLGPNGGATYQFTVLNTDAIEKGTVCILTDPRTASGAVITTSGGAVAGIAASEKVASDGATTIGCHTEGIFDIYASAGLAIAAGDYVVLSGSNTIQGAEKVKGDGAFGQALEASASATAETILVRLTL